MLQELINELTATLAQCSTPQAATLTRVRIEALENRECDWTPNEYHHVLRDQVGEHCVTWRVAADGIRVLGEAGEPRRTKGAPSTLGRIFATFGHEIGIYSEAFQVDARTIAAVIATESGGKPTAERAEPQIHDVSIGLMQTLTNTAKGVAPFAIKRMNDIAGDAVRLAGPSVPKGGDLKQWRELLSQPRVSILLGTALLASIDEHFGCKGDPILMYAAFNAGSPRPSSRTPWGLVYYGSALDSFSRWYGDACAVVTGG